MISTPPRHRPLVTVCLVWTVTLVVLSTALLTPRGERPVDPVPHAIERGIVLPIDPGQVLRLPGAPATSAVPSHHPSPTRTPPAQTTVTPSSATSASPGTSSGPPRPGTSRPHAGSVRSFWLHLNSTPVSDAQLAEQARLHDDIVLNAWEAHFIPKLKAANPAVRVFVYKDLSSTRSYACQKGTDHALLPAGVGYCHATRHHPDWFLTSRTGQRFEYAGYPGHWQMDVGNPAYQDAWADNVIRETRANGFDGVLMDNALFACATYHPGTCPAKYPTDSSFQEAYLSMLGSLRPKFTAAGVLAVANLADARLHNGAWDSYMRHLDGGFDEWWLAFDDDHLLPEYQQGWSRQMAEIIANEANGKFTWVQPHFGDRGRQARLYALASYLMATNGGSAISSISVRDGYGDPSPRLASSDLGLGTPRGGLEAVQHNVFRRDFSCGLVVVNSNPPKSATVTVKLDEHHTDDAGRRVDSISLSGTSGAVLHRAC